MWTAGWDAFVTNGLMASTVVFGNIWGEGALRRWPMRRRTWKVLLGVGVALGVSFLMTWIWAAVAALSLDDIGSVHHVVALKYRWGNLVGTGFAAAMGMLTAEKWRSRPKSFVINYIFGGLFAGLTAGALWSISAYYWVQNLCWAGCIVREFWIHLRFINPNNPDDLYVGWIRVLRESPGIEFNDARRQTQRAFYRRYPNVGFS